MSSSSSDAGSEEQRLHGPHGQDQYLYLNWTSNQYPAKGCRKYCYVRRRKV